MENPLQTALGYHRKGLLDDAARIYRNVLAGNPAHADALLLLGLVAMQQGDAERAAGLFREAVVLNPGVALYHANLAEAYRMLGRYEQAAGEYRTALTLDAQMAPAANNLGLCLQSLGQTEAAIAAFTRALEIDASFAAAHNNLAMALYREGDQAGALEHFGDAVALDPGLAEARSNLGQLLLELDRPHEALIHCREAVRLSPECAPARLSLGRALRMLEQPEEAEASYVEALRLAPGLAVAWNDLGLLAQEQGKLAESLERYETSLRLDPGFVPAECNRGVVLAERGDFAGAVQAFRAALQGDSSHAEAYYQLASLLGAELPEADLTAIRRLLAVKALSLDERSTLHAALGLVLDARGHHAAAAFHVHQANALCLADWQKRGRAYDVLEHERLIESLLASCTPAFFERLQGSGLDTERHVFIVGLPRSGTTLTEQILASHPQVHGGGELRVVRDLFESLPRSIDPRSRAAECLGRLDRETVRRLATHLDERLAALDPHATRLVDKMPENYLYLGLLAVLLPHARFIHCRRDLRDVAVSCWITRFRQVRWASDPDHIASRIHTYQRIMDHWRKTLPISWLDIDYEDLVADLETGARRLVAWCGLDWDPACLAFHQNRRAVRSASLAQVRRPIYGSAVGRWKHYWHTLAPLLTRIDQLQPGAPAHQGSGLDLSDKLS
jgi:tetratricopeptide (TPR) repeat protein